MRGGRLILEPQKASQVMGRAQKTNKFRHHANIDWHRPVALARKHRDDVHEDCVTLPLLWTRAISGLGSTASHPAPLNPAVGCTQRAMLG